MALPLSFDTSMMLSITFADKLRAVNSSSLKRKSIS